MKFILFLLTVVVLLNQYMFARSLICDKSEDSRYFPCRSHDNNGFLDRSVPLPFIRSKKLEGNRKKFQSRQSLNILRLQSESIEHNPGPMQNHAGRLCADSNVKFFCKNIFSLCSVVREVGKYMYFKVT